MVNWVRFRARADGRQFLHLNTHLDHISDQARLEGSKVILRQLSLLCADQPPVLLTGDFNSPPEPSPNDHADTPPARPYHIFGDAGFSDAYQTAKHADDRPQNTFHGFKGVEFSAIPDSSRWRIDWILIFKRRSVG